MVFNQDPTKFLSRKSHFPKHPDVNFNSRVVEKVKIQKDLGLKLDERLNFRKHLKDKFAIVNSKIGMLKKLSKYLPRHSLITLYKAFTRSHLVYGKPNNTNVCNKIESLQYIAALAITGAIRA